MPVIGLDVIVPQLIAAVLKQTAFDKRLNTLIVLAVYAAWVAVSLAFGLRGMPIGSPEEFATSFGVAFPTALAAGKVAYDTLWQNVLGEDVLEYKTSIVKGPTEDEVEEDEEPIPGEGQG